MKTKWIPLIGFYLFVFSEFATPSACTCIPYYPRGSIESFASYKTIFVGKVVKVTPPPGRKTQDGRIIWNSGDLVTYEFQISRILRGRADLVEKTVKVVSPQSEASCGVNFQSGSTYLVLPHAQDSLRVFSVGLCSGNTLLGQDHSKVDSLATLLSAASVQFNRDSKHRPQKYLNINKRLGVPDAVNECGLLPVLGRRPE